jgi:hypothetical protein
MTSYDDKEGRRRIVREVVPYFTRAALEKLHKRTLEESIAIRSVARFEADGRLNTDGITGLSVPELKDCVRFACAFT